MSVCFTLSIYIYIYHIISYHIISYIYGSSQFAPNLVPTLCQLRNSGTRLGGTRLGGTRLAAQGFLLQKFCRNSAQGPIRLTGDRRHYAQYPPSPTPPVPQRGINLPSLPYTSINVDWRPTLPPIWGTGGWGPHSYPHKGGLWIFQQPRGSLSFSIGRGLAAFCCVWISLLCCGMAPGMKPAGGLAHPSDRRAAQFGPGTRSGTR